VAAISKSSWCPISQNACGPRSDGNRGRGQVCGHWPRASL